MFQFRATKRLGVACAVLGMLHVFGCAEPTSEEEGDAPDATNAAQVADPQGAYFANVTANGTGCPRGSTNTRISEDGLTFTTTFAAYKVAVEPNIDFDVRDCQLGIKFHSPQNRTFSVQTFSYRGFARLGAGVNGRQTANYYFQGTAIDPAKEKATTLAGPYEGAFEFQDQVISSNRIWSPCGVDRELNVRTRLELRNSAARGSGFMSLNEVEGTAKIEVRLVSRPCDAPRTPSGEPKGGQSDGPTASAPIGTPPTGTPSATQPTPTEPVGHPPGSGTASADPFANPSTTPGEPTLITVIPGVVRRGQSFSVSWSSAPSDPVSTRYRVRITRFGDPAGTLIWESPETGASFLEVPASVLSVAGEYDVVVVARAGTRAAFSAPALVRVVASP